MSVEIVPSVLAADFGRLLEEVQAAVAGGAKRIQVDVMDGHFVPNISVGLPVVEALARSTRVHLDVHLMIVQPERWLDRFAAAGAGGLTVHVEATPHVHRAIERIHELGLEAGVALNPATPLATVEEILAGVDLILLMTVNPGFGGQKFIPTTLSKIERLRDRLDAEGLSAALQVDGGINVATARLAARAGANQLVAGTAVFAAGVPVAEALQALREAASTGWHERLPKR